MLELYSVNNSRCSLERGMKIKLDLKDASIINSNNDFYYLYIKDMIVLLKKSNLTIVKSFNIYSNNLGLLKISDKIMLLFHNDKDKLVANIYSISSNGIGIDNIKEKEFVNGRVINIFTRGN